MFSLLLLLQLAGQLLDACQEIRLVSEDGGVVVGRSLEFAMPFSTYFMFEPVGHKTTYPLLPNCATANSFTNDYEVFKFKGTYQGRWMKFVMGGINNKGVSVAVLYFPGYADFPTQEEVVDDACANPVPQTRLAEYVLAKYASVAQIQEALDNGTFPFLYGEVDEPGVVHPTHYSFIDKTGEGIILEDSIGRVRRVYNNTVGVFTNSPRYDWHMENLKQFPQMQYESREGFKYVDQNNKKHVITTPGAGSGLMGLPGDYMPPSRFVRAATLLSLTLQTKRPKTTEDAVHRAFHLMNAADIPDGVLGHSEDHDEDYQVDENQMTRQLQKSRKKQEKRNKKAKKASKKQGLVHEDTPLPGDPESDMTYWVTVKDLEKGCVYYRGYFDMTMKRICFGDKLTEAKMIKLGENKNASYEDVTKKMKSQKDKKQGRSF